MKYRNHDARVVLLSQQYGEHVSAMTTEALHGKAEIAEELAARDLEIARMRDRIERLRGALKTASGRFLDANDLQSADDCLEWAGDMEPPLNGFGVLLAPTFEREETCNEDCCSSETNRKWPECAQRPQAERRASRAAGI